MPKLRTYIIIILLVLGLVVGLQISQFIVFTQYESHEGHLGQHLKTRKRVLLQRMRVGEEFPHWQFISNRPQGTTRQLALNSIPLCGDLLDVAALEMSGAATALGGGSIRLGINASLTNAAWHQLSHSGRFQWLLTRYGCDWYPMRAWRINGTLGHKRLSPLIKGLEKHLQQFVNAAKQHNMMLVEDDYHIKVGECDTAYRKLEYIRPIDVLIEAEGSTNSPSLQTPPSPQRLATLAPSSPTLVHWIGTQMTLYHQDLIMPRWVIEHDDEGLIPKHLIMANTSSAHQLASWLTIIQTQRRSQNRTSSLWTYNELSIALEMLKKNKSVLLLDILAATRKGMDMRERYEGMWDTIRAANQNMSNPALLKAPPVVGDCKRKRRLHTTGQLAVVLRDRLVRLSPSSNPFFEDALVEGMKKTGNLAMEGVLAHAPLHIKASYTDAMAGHWNMSDLPPWLTLPSFVNVANCLDPMNQRMDNKGSLGYTYQRGEDLYQPKRSILVVGSSHAEGFISMLCRQYIHSREMRSTPSTGNDEDPIGMASICSHETHSFITRKQLNLTYPQDESIPLDQDAFPIAFCRTRLRIWEELEVCSRVLLSGLGLQPQNATKIHTNDPLARRLVERHSNLGLSEEIRPNTFSYKNFLLNSHVPQLDKLKGVFSHIIFFSGPWEMLDHDETITAHSENTAITLDLLEELFAPREKIVVYNLHSHHTVELDHVDAASNLVSVRTKTFPNFVGFDNAEKYKTYSFSLKGDLFGPDSCNNPFRAAKYRDAHLVASWPTTRARVRAAWKKEFEMIMRNEKDAKNQPSLVYTDTLGERVPVEIADFFPATAQSLGGMLVDGPGHHYRDNVLESITQRTLRDHVCPPKYVVADSKKVAHSNPKYRSYATPSYPFPNAMPSSLPRYIRVRQTINASTTMPKFADNEKEILNLYPLLKLPSAAVMEGLYTAIFGNSRSGRGEGAVYRHVKGNDPHSVHPTMASLNQYDVFSISPHCACLRLNAVTKGVYHPTFNATHEQMVYALSNISSSLGITFAQMRQKQRAIELQAEYENKKVNYSWSPLEFQIQHEQHDNTFLLQTYPPCHSLNDTKLCDSCKKYYGVTLNPLEVLRRRMLAHAYVWHRRDPR